MAFAVELAAKFAANPVKDLQMTLNLRSHVLKAYHDVYFESNSFGRVAF